jgi:hypothetical protein
MYSRGRLPRATRHVDARRHVHVHVHAGSYLKYIVDLAGLETRICSIIILLHCVVLTYIIVRRKLPLPREPAGAIPKEGTNLYLGVAKLEGAVERAAVQFLRWLLFGENSCAIIVVCL